VNIAMFIARLSPLLMPPRIVRITARPRWLALDRRGRLHEVVAFAQREDGSTVGLVADRRGGLRPVRAGWRWLPGAPHSLEDALDSPPEVVVPVVDLTDAIPLDGVSPFTPEAIAELYAKLRAAAESEWARVTLAAFLEDPARLIRRHLELISEHGRPTTDAAWLEQFAAITYPAVGAAEINPVDSCQGGNA
jgi:hypothetical protein